MTYDFLMKIVLRWLLIAELGKEKGFHFGKWEYAEDTYEFIKR